MKSQGHIDMQIDSVSKLEFEFKLEVLDCNIGSIPFWNNTTKW